MEDESYDDIFSTNKNFVNSSFYHLTPNIDENSTLNTTNESFGINDEYIEDTYIDRNDSKNEAENKNYTLKHNPYDYNNKENEKKNSSPINTLENIHLIDPILILINKNITVYNYNIFIYIQTINILQRYFQDLSNILQKTFTENIDIIRNFMYNDECKNIQRNYDPLIKVLNHFYLLYEKNLIKKIHDIEIYMMIIEKQLMLHSWILIERIWFLKNNIKLSPKNKSINHYKNNDMHIEFYNIKIYFENLFNTFYKNFK